MCEEKMEPASSGRWWLHRTMEYGLELSTPKACATGRNSSPRSCNRNSSVPGKISTALHQSHRQTDVLGVKGLEKTTANPHSSRCSPTDGIHTHPHRRGFERVQAAQNCSCSGFFQLKLQPKVRVWKTVEDYKAMRSCTFLL